MDKAFILSEIKRTAAENDGKALGFRGFAKDTGIKPYNWGTYWDNWSDALQEAGFEPNLFFRTHSYETLIEKLIELIRERGQFPLQRQIVRKSKADSSFPGERSFREKLGNKVQMASHVLAYCQNRTGFDDVIKICSPIVSEEKPEVKKE